MHFSLIKKRRMKNDLLLNKHAHTCFSHISFRSNNNARISSINIRENRRITLLWFYVWKAHWRIIVLTCRTKWKEKKIWKCSLSWAREREWIEAREWYESLENMQLEVTTTMMILLNEKKYYPMMMIWLFF